jgi:hypothetical protein
MPGAHVAHRPFAHDEIAGKPLSVAEYLAHDHRFERPARRRLERPFRPCRRPDNGLLIETIFFASMIARKLDFSRTLERFRPPLRLHWRPTGKISG